MGKEVGFAYAQRAAFWCQSPRSVRGNDLGTKLPNNRVGTDQETDMQEYLVYSKSLSQP